MAQVTRLCPLTGFLSRRVIPLSNCSPILRNSHALPRRCPFVPSLGNHVKLVRDSKLFHVNKLTRQPNIFQSRNSIRFYCEKTPKNGLTEPDHIRYWETFEAEMKQLTLIQRYKKMFKEFWYVGIPVVGITSALWLGTFYLIAASGYVKPLVSKLRDFGVPETIAKALESDKVGTLAIAVVMYKLATPARYAVSIAGTVKAIKILLRRGMIKPVPPKNKLKEIVLKKVYEKSKQQ
ncbi:uncharacterized protein C18orf19 homolog A [Tetranychus urticae]|uniref:DUF1279 domain-containing protein n=1 Tax=Tetranychus urticae TaxID=32264 RepID=T1KXN5_TETUR|nr:uncharacterized protein C18orf19 homolog A [Tetranychus urticae]